MKSLTTGVFLPLLAGASLLAGCTENPPDNTPYPATITEKRFTAGSSAVVPMIVGKMTVLMPVIVPDRYELDVQYCTLQSPNPCTSTTREVTQDTYGKFEKGEKVFYQNGVIKKAP